MSLIRYTFSESYTEADMALPSRSREPRAEVHQDLEVQPRSLGTGAVELAGEHKVYVALLLVLLCVAGVAIASSLDINALGWMFHMGWAR